MKCQKCDAEATCHIWNPDKQDYDDFCIEHYKTIKNS